jgi:hypothetical protein
VTHHGYLRTTEDADIVFRRTPESEQALLAVSQQINACWIGEEIDPSTGNVPGFPEIAVGDLFADSVEHGKLRFVSLAWLPRLKERAGRHRDRDDLENLPSA